MNVHAAQHQACADCLTRNIFCRLQLDREVEAQYEDRLSRLCYQERVAQHNQRMWGNSRRADSMELRACKEYAERYGAGQGQFVQQQQRASVF